MIYKLIFKVILKEQKSPEYFGFANYQLMYSALQPENGYPRDRVDGLVDLLLLNMEDAYKGRCLAELSAELYLKFEDMF